VPGAVSRRRPARRRTGPCARTRCPSTGPRRDRGRTVPRGRRVSRPRGFCRAVRAAPRRRGSVVERRLVQRTPIDQPRGPCPIGRPASTADQLRDDRGGRTNRPWPSASSRARVGRSAKNSIHTDVSNDDATYATAPGHGDLGLPAERHGPLMLAARPSFALGPIVVTPLPVPTVSGPTTTLPPAAPPERAVEVTLRRHPSGRVMRRLGV
jgi:hypothetical protein